ncbi:hypothetical protein BKA81DRAFT_18105 [Phyllosticta paracitricarpa]|uniref:Dihydrodipicolinate synthase n=1 Tax=Phyllosticta citricarpa TaxID=55181 RepID=A0ABR1MET6_9PEZI
MDGWMDGWRMECFVFFVYARVGCMDIWELLQLIEAGKARDYKRARQIHGQLLPLTKAVHHRGSHMEATVGFKHVLVARGILDHATVRSPLVPLGIAAEEEVYAAVAASKLPKVA